MLDLASTPVAARSRDGSAAARLVELRNRIPLGHGCLSIVSVVCCKVEVTATGRSLFQRSPTECVYVCVLECDQCTNNHPQPRVDGRGQTKKERKKEN